MPRTAYAATMKPGGRYGIGLVEEGEPGYIPLGLLPTFGSYDEAAEFARAANEQTGLSEEDAAMIVASTMRAQNGRDKRCQKPS